MNMLVVAFSVIALSVSAARAGGMDEFMKHSGAIGTEGGRGKNDTGYHTSNSKIPHLPFVRGYMGTHGTYRFLTVVEQTAVVVGEPKHGVWRIQENGFIREFRKKGLVGLRDGVDPNADNLSTANLDIIKANYAHYIPEEGWTGYKYPEDRIEGATGYVNYIDLSIYHPKYVSKYESHVAIDMPMFYCTMTQAEYPHLKNVWKYATAQPEANKLGPLAKRAGMDIKENFFNVLRLDFFQDAGVWANVGLGANKSDQKVSSLNDIKNKIQKVNYRRVDMSKTDVEVYLIERPFFNKPYIFVAIVMENKVGPSYYSYIRNDGAYWVALQKHHNKTTGISNTAVHYPPVHVIDYPTKGMSSLEKIYSLPVYGHHHPDRHRFGMKGGACPSRGGDWSHYPWTNAGGGFPTNYEEITPMCDGLVVDIKLWANLWTSSWNDLHLGLGNGGFDSLTVNYTMDANVYGNYTDPFLRGKDNPEMIVLTADGRGVVGLSETKPELVTLKLNFTRKGTYLYYNNVSISEMDESPVKKCPDQKICPTPKECPSSTTKCPQNCNCDAAIKAAKEKAEKNDDKVPGWATALLVLCVLIVVLAIANLVVMLFAILHQRDAPNKNGDGVEMHESGTIKNIHAGSV